MRVSKGDFPAWVTGLVYLLGQDSTDEHGFSRKSDWHRLMEILRDADLTPDEKETALTIIENMVGGREAAETWLNEPSP